jgi:hypothetical protein
LTRGNVLTLVSNVVIHGTSGKVGYLAGFLLGGSPNVTVINNGWTAADTGSGTITPPFPWEPASWPSRTPSTPC